MHRRHAAMIIAALVMVVGFCVELRVQFGGHRFVKAIDDLGELAAALIAACAGARRAAASAGRLRWSWILIAAGAGCWALGEAIWSAYELMAHRATPFPSLADAGFLAFPPLALTGLLLRPAAVFGRHGRLRVMLDALLVAASLFVISWVTALGQVLHAGADSPLAAVVGLAYPVGDLLLLTVTLAVVAHARASARLGLGLLAASFAALSLGDSGFAYFTAVGTYQTGNLIDAGWLGGFLILAAAAWCDRPEVETAVRGMLSQSALLLPYLPAGLGIALTAYRVRGHHADNASLVGALIIIAALMGRQLLVLTDNRRLVAQVTRQALYDGLTGLANRALFRDRLTLALQQQPRNLRPLSLLVLDLDDFKTVNDTLGHAAGDELLIRFGERLQGATRAGDTVARLGGDEFAILTDCDPDILAERLLECLTLPIRIQHRPQRVRASIGIVTLTADELPLAGDELLDRADQAMYAGKRRGKGQAAHYLPPLAAKVGEGNGPCVAAEQTVAAANTMALGRTRR